MKTLAIFMLGFGILGGLAGMFSSMKYSRPHYAELPESERKFRKRETILRGWSLFLTALLGLLLLLAEFASGIEIVVAVAIVLACSEAALTSMKPSIGAIAGGFTPPLARDVSTGEYLGTVVGQRREGQSHKVVSYRIKTKDGNLIEKPSSAVVIEFQS